MPGDLSPGDALSPAAFASLYAGGLEIENETDRLDASLAILLLGRLGLRPTELIHLHEGWIDWRTGELRIPAQDPCACAQCWARARSRAAKSTATTGIADANPANPANSTDTANTVDAADSANTADTAGTVDTADTADTANTADAVDSDERDPADFIGTDLWSPPGGDAAARALAFGWSRRLTAALGTVFDEREYIDADIERLDALVSAAAANATGIDPAEVDLEVLRASAIEFLASAGVGPRRLADLTGIDEATAGDFARVSAGEVRDHLYRTLGEDDPPLMDDTDSRYRVVADPKPFDGEPFDPKRFDADWRADRAASSEPRSRNPRPAEPPEGVPFEPADQLRPREPAGTTGFAVVPESLAQWVSEVQSPDGVPARGSADESQAAADATASDDSDAAEASTAPDSPADPETDLAPADPSEEEPVPEHEAAVTSGVTEDPRAQVTEPVEFSFDTRFAAAELDDHRPSGGTVVLGQEEFVVLSRDDTGTAGYLRIELDNVVELVPGYVPERLAEHFGNTVGIAYRNEEGERKVVVCEVGSQIQLALVQAVFRSILTDVPTLVTDLPQYERPVEGDELRLSAEREALRFWGESGGFAKLRYDSIVDVDEGPITEAEDAESGLVVQQVTANDTVATTRVRPTSDRLLRLLGRFLTLHHDRNQQRAATVSLSSDEVECLEVLAQTADGGNPAAVLDEDRQDFSDLVSSLEMQDLVRQTTTGVEMTAAGLLVIEDEDDVVRTV